MIGANRQPQLIFFVATTYIKSRAGKSVNRIFLEDELPVVQVYADAGWTNVID